MTTRGRLILIEGLDRTGKSTQCEYLHKTLLKGSKLYKFPDRTTAIGKIINEYLTSSSNASELSDQAIHLLFSSNRWELQNEIRKTLLQGTDVILDRYVYSGIAYSMAKNIKGMDYEWCLNCDKGLIKPDLTIFFYNKAIKELSEREDYGAEKYEVQDFQELVFDSFVNIFKNREDLNYKETHLNLLDVAGKSIQQVSDMLKEIVTKFELSNAQTGDAKNDDSFIYFA